MADVSTGGVDGLDAPPPSPSDDDMPPCPSFDDSLELDVEMPPAGSDEGSFDGEKLFLQDMGRTVASTTGKGWRLLHTPPLTNQPSPRARQQTPPAGEAGNGLPVNPEVCPDPTMNTEVCPDPVAGEPALLAVDALEIETAESHDSHSQDPHRHLTASGANTDAATDNESDEHNTSQVIRVGFGSYRFDTSQLYYDPDTAFVDVEPGPRPTGYTAEAVPDSPHRDHHRHHQQHQQHHHPYSESEDAINTSVGHTEEGEGAAAALHAEQMAAGGGAGGQQQQHQQQQQQQQQGGPQGGAAREGAGGGGSGSSTPETQVIRLDFSTYRMDTSHLYYNAEEAVAGGRDHHHSPRPHRRSSSAGAARTQQQQQQQQQQPKKQARRRSIATISPAQVGGASGSGIVSARPRRLSRKASGKALVVPPKDGGCGACGKNRAVVGCADCRSALCRPCSAAAHAGVRGSRRPHRVHDLPNLNTIPCAKCRAMEGVLSCRECDSAAGGGAACAPRHLCVACWEGEHRHALKAPHAPAPRHILCDRHPLSESSVAGAAASRFCGDCGANLCMPCWHRIHSNRHFLHHKTVSLYGEGNHPEDVRRGDASFREPSQRQERERPMLREVKVKAKAKPLARGGGGGMQVRREREAQRTGVDPMNRYRLMNFFTVYSPQKLPSVMPTLRKFSGREEALFELLADVFGPEPSHDALGSALPFGWRVVQSSEGDVYYLHESGVKQWLHPAVVPIEAPSAPMVA